jgi:hypothetical protein
MARKFNGTSDQIITSYGAGPTNAPLTFAAVIKMNADGVTECIMTAHNGSGLSAIDFQHNSSNKWVLEFNSIGFAFSTTTVTVADGWVLVAVTKTSGTSTARFHKFVYSTDAWVHENFDAAFGGTGRTPTEMRFSNNEGGARTSADIAIGGTWDRVLADADLEQLPYTLQQWFASAPKTLWLLDQSATSQTLGDLTGGPWLVVRPQAAAAGFDPTTVPPFTHAQHMTFSQRIGQY